MALNGIQIFKLSPKKNCKECGCPTCMAFSMKVAQGAMKIEQCPHMSEEAVAALSEATAPPMKTVKIGKGSGEFSLGGETVLFRHEKTFVSRPRYGVSLSSSMPEDEIDEKLSALLAVDYERIGERMYTELISLSYEAGDSKEKYLDLVRKAAALSRTLILNVKDEGIARSALELTKDSKPLLNGADAENYAAMSALSSEYGAALGVCGEDLSKLYETILALEKAGNKNLVLDLTGKSPKEAFDNAVIVRKAALKDQDRPFGYPSLIDLARLCPGDEAMQAALASVFTLKYGSIILMERMSYAAALPLFGLRQNVFTDPQKPMKVEPGIYPLNGADEHSLVVTTVDFALTYFVVRGELERSGVPINFAISDAGGLSVLTSWAAGKFSSGTISAFIREQVEPKVKCRRLVIPGKVAVLKGDLESKLPGWEIIVGPREAVQLVSFLKELNK